MMAASTLWVREHNLWATELAAQDPSLTDEQLYQEAKAIVTGELQAITYNEFLPALLGEDAISDYEGYDSTVNPSISNLFSTAIYRFGHSMLSSELLRLENDESTADEGNLALQSAFLRPVRSSIMILIRYCLEQRPKSPTKSTTRSLTMSATSCLVNRGTAGSIWPH